MGFQSSCRVSPNVINPSPPPILTDPFKASCNKSRPFSMRRAMGLRQEKQIWSRPATVRINTPGIESRSLYPQLDVNRFVHAFSLKPSDRGSNGSPSSKGEQPRTLKDVLASSNRRPSSVFGIGLGMEPDAVEPKPKSIQQAAEETGVREDEAEDEDLDLDEDTSAENGLEEEEGIAAEIAEVGEGDLEPPMRPLDFHISNEMFLAAQASAAGSPESYWSHTMYERVQDDGTVDKVKVHYCTNRDSMERVCKDHFLGEPVLGFDLEWMAFARRESGPRENISVIQIASPSHIGLFHTALFPKGDVVAAPTFQRIMGNPKVSKVGVNVLADSTRLRNYLNVNSCGIFELSHLYRLVKFLPQKQFEMINRKPVSLAVQVEDQLGLPLFKGKTVRTSNWMKPLDESQLLYSASDAYASVRLYYALETKREALNPCPPRPSHAEFGHTIKVGPLKEVDENASRKEQGDSDLLVDKMTMDLNTLIISEVQTSETISTSSSKDSDSATPKSKPSKTKSPKPSSPTTPLPSDPRVLAADLKTEQYRASKDVTSSATPSILRAYYLWADDDSLTPKTIAGLLRDPPLQPSTVVSYILNAIMAEKFPYSKERARRDLLPLLPPEIFKNSRKFGSFARECREVDEE